MSTGGLNQRDVSPCSEAHICNDVDAELGEVGDHRDVLLVRRGNLRVLHQLREVLLGNAGLLRRGNTNLKNYIHSGKICRCALPSTGCRAG